MSLLAPTTGELLDRMSILHMKRMVAPQEDHFNVEWAALQGALAKRALRREVLSLEQELREVNQELWEATERMGTVPKVTDENAYDVAYLGLKLFRLNVRRNALREDIDRAMGEWRGPEKLK